ncbi:MAG: hypothetical protein AB7K36_30385 [Chloroflexota bacterium]
MSEPLTQDDLEGMLPSEIVELFAAERAARATAEQQRNAAVAALREAGTVLIFLRDRFEREGSTIKVNTLKSTLDKIHAVLASAGEQPASSSQEGERVPYLPPHESFPAEFIVKGVRQGQPRMYESDFEATSSPSGALAAADSLADETDALLRHFRRHTKHRCEIDRDAAAALAAYRQERGE